jgi:hypothetical protein
VLQIWGKVSSELFGRGDGNIASNRGGSTFDRLIKMPAEKSATKLSQDDPSRPLPPTCSIAEVIFDEVWALPDRSLHALGELENF